MNTRERTVTHLPGLMSSTVAGADWLDGAPMDPEAVKLEPLPTIPGFPFLHAGMAAVIAGPTGGGRSYLIETCLYDAARAGVCCLYLGDEVLQDEFNARAAEIAGKRGDTINGTLRAQSANCRYVDLLTAIGDAEQRPGQWAPTITERYDVVVIDPLSSVADALGLNFNNAGDEYLAFYALLVQPLRRAGVAVVMLDNIGHADDARNRPKGVSEKGHKADLTFWCKATSDPASLILTAGKVRATRCAHRRGDTWRILLADQQLAPVEHDEPAAPFRPTFLMERSSRLIEQQPGLSKSAIRTAVKGKHDAVDLALELLMTERLVENRGTGQSWALHSLKPYREVDEKCPAK